jgi:hypothetical protein
VIRIGPLLLALLCTGCAQLSAETFCAQYAEAFCEASKGCCQAAGFKREGCRNFHLGVCQSAIARTLAGHSTLDRAAADACLKEVRAASPACPGRSGDNPFPLSRYDACRKVVVGLASENQPCGEENPDCAPSFSCTQGPDGGSCRPMPCGGPCPSGSFCAFGSERKCQPLPAQGEACVQSLRCASETDYCASNGNCQPKSALGEACFSSGTCLSRRCEAQKCVEGPDPYCIVANSQGN